ncbi:MAG: Vgb family protein [bacterium]
MKKIALMIIFSFLAFGFSAYTFADGTQQINTSNANASNSNIATQQLKQKILNFMNNIKGLNNGKSGQVTVQTITSKSFHNPEGIAISSNGNIWVVNYGNGTVTELNNKYQFISSYNVGGNPENIAIDISGDVWVVKGNGYIAELSPQGVWLNGYDTGAFSDDIAISPGGLIYVTSTLNNSVALLEMTSQGQLVSSYTIGDVLGGPHNVAIDAIGNVWVTKENPSVVLNLNISTNVFTAHPAGSNPWGVAIAPNGNVFVVDNGVWPSPGRSVTEFNPEGVIFGIFPTGKYPKQIAIDTDGDIWVTNQGADSVTELNPQGIVLGSYHVGKSPYGIAIAHNGDVIVSNKKDNTLSIIKGAEKTPEYFPYSGPQWP